MGQQQLQQQQLHQQQIQQQQKYELQQQECSQQQYGHNTIHSQYQVQTAQQYGQVHLVPELEDPYGHCQSQPVILRDPEATYVDPGRMRLNKGKRPPPPPRRSEETQLSNSAV